MNKNQEIKEKITQVEILIENTKEAIQSHLKEIDKYWNNLKALSNKLNSIKENIKKSCHSE
jgi:sugar-specific transcriptional regulator TrmB